MTSIYQAPGLGAQLAQDLIELPGRIEAAWALLSTEPEVTSEGAAAEIKEPADNLERGPSFADQVADSIGCAVVAYNTTRPLLAWLAGIPGRYAKNPAMEAGLRAAGGSAGQALGEYFCNQSGENSYVGYGTTVLAGALSAAEVFLHDKDDQPGASTGQDALHSVPKTIVEDRLSARAHAIRGAPYRVYNPRVQPVETPPSGVLNRFRDGLGKMMLGSTLMVGAAAIERQVRLKSEQNDYVIRLSAAYAEPDADLSAVFAKVPDAEMLNRVLKKLQGDALVTEADAAAFRARLNPHEQARFDLATKTIATMGVDGHLRKLE